MDLIKVPFLIVSNSVRKEETTVYVNVHTHTRTHTIYPMSNGGTSLPLLLHHTAACETVDLSLRC